MNGIIMSGDGMNRAIMNRARTSQPGSLLWFARHEARLAWRDWASLMTAGDRRRVRTVILGFLGLAVFLHLLAWVILAPSGVLRDEPDRHLLVTLTGTLLAAWSLMLSQALESVTRAFYARGDLDLILTSPAAASRLFAVRLAAMAVSVLCMTLLLAAPFLNVAAWMGGPRWLAGYAAMAALAMLAVAVAAAIAAWLFRVAGPERTRTMAQVTAAVIGAAFAITVQFAAIFSYGALPGMSVPRFLALEHLTPGEASPLWWPARAVLGEPLALAGLCGAALCALAASVLLVAPRFGALALSTANAPPPARAHAARRPLFRHASPARALRQKEWVLLLRDPWLISQTLMQLLYLLPAMFLLWRDFRGDAGAPALLAPVLILAAGQLAGGLAWLAVSGEDAPELIATAPVSAARVLRSRTEAVLGGIALLFIPLTLLLGWTAPGAGLITAAGVFIAAGSATAIQHWFRAQARRSLFRKRQTSSRAATFAEALSSTLWAVTGALAAGGAWLLAAVSGGLVLAVLGLAWLISPARRAEGVG